MTPGQQLTRDSEGTYDQCAKAHVPTRSSGLTLDGGYDCWLKSQSKILGDLISARLPRKVAYHFSHASGLRGRCAKQWLENSEYSQFEMSPEQQNKLFSISYAEMEESARKLYEKPDCCKEYGWILTWDNLLQPIRDIIIDLRFRGDWTPKTRKWLAAAVKNNNLEVFAGAMSSWQYWRMRRRVPKDRFRRRKEFLKGGQL